MPDCSGGFHVTDNWNIHADGTGDQGNRYRVNYSDNFSINVGSGGLPFTSSNPVAIRVTGQGQAPNLKITAITLTTINANGDVTSTVSNIKATCKLGGTQRPLVRRCEAPAGDSLRQALLYFRSHFHRVRLLVRGAAWAGRLMVPFTGS